MSRKAKYGVTLLLLTAIVIWNWSGIKSVLRPLYTSIYEQTVLEEPPQELVITTSNEAWQSIVACREDALKLGFLLAGKEDLVPAQFNDTVQGLIRLKGDYLSHLKEKKWSFRIELKKNKSLFGMQRFSIHHPYRRNHIYEWVWHQWLQMEGLLALDYRFIKVTVNDQPLGLYALEEHFGQQYLENRALSRGMVVRFDEDARWEGLAHNPQYTENNAYISSVIDAYQSKAIASDTALNQQFEKVKLLLESFRMGERKTHEVFDVYKLARFFALSDLLGAHHGLFWHNARFYYNPSSGLLEPIGFDADCNPEVQQVIGEQAGIWGDSTLHLTYFKQVFADQQFIHQYKEALADISDTTYLNRTLQTMQDSVKLPLQLLKSEFPYASFDTGWIRRNAQYIDGLLKSNH